MQNEPGTVFLDTTSGPITFPAPAPARLPPVVITAEPPANQGNQKVVIGGLAIVVMVLAWVGLRAHGE